MRTVAVLWLVASLRAEWLDLTGARVWYTDSGGRGPAVALLHAATGSTESWEKQTPAFVKAGYRVIAFDRRGSGRTETAPTSGATTAADDLESLRLHLGIDRMHVVGTAAGGFTAFDYVLSFPERVLTLTIANSLGGIQDPDYLELGRRIRPPQFNGLPPDFRELSPSYRAANPEGVKRWLEIERNAHREPGGQRQTMRNKITFATIKQISAPVLLITGDADFYMPQAVLRTFQAHLKSAKAVILPETGHSGYWEQPELFNRAVLEFAGPANGPSNRRPPPGSRR